MLEIERFNVPASPPRLERDDTVLAALPACARQPFEFDELRGFPAFALMRLVRDWVEGEDEAGAGLWRADTPDRLYESIDPHLAFAHAIVGHLCAAPQDSALRDSNLLWVVCNRYPQSVCASYAIQLAGVVSDEVIPERWHLAPWWRAAAMLGDSEVYLAALGMQYLWLRRHELDLRSLAAVEAHTTTGLVRPCASPPLHLSFVLSEVLGPDEADWPQFQRALLEKFALDSTPAEARYAADNLGWEQLTGMPYDALIS